MSDAVHPTLAGLPDRVSGGDVELRRWRAGDAELLHRAVLDSVEHLRPWMAWIPPEPLTLAKRRSLIAEWAQEAERGGDVVFGVFRGAAVAGGAGLHHRDGPGILEIGYWVHPDYLRQGVATTAASLLTDAAFTVPGIHRVEIHHDQANTASAGIPQRLGFTLSATTPDTVMAPGEAGVDCTWTMTRQRWHSEHC